MGTEHGTEQHLQLLFIRLRLGIRCVQMETKKMLAIIIPCSYDVG